MEFNIPTEFNGVQLQKELKAVGVKLNDYPRLVDNKLILDIDKKDETKAEAIVNAHIGIDNSAEIAAQRTAILDRLGLTAEEAAILLG
jgi:hypothetical protein